MVKFSYDSRKNPRFKAYKDYKYIFGDKESRCEVLNISDEGMYLKVPQILEINDIITIIFEESKNTRYSIEAVVKHTNYNYIGIKFLGSANIDKTTLQQFISNLKEKPNLNFI